MKTQCGKKTTDGNEHKQSTMRRSEYNAITITTSDSIKQPDYNLSYNLPQNSLSLFRKSKIVETWYSTSILLVWDSGMIIGA